MSTSRKETPIICEICQGSYTKTNRAHHIKTNKHQRWEEKRRIKFEEKLMMMNFNNSQNYCLGSDGIYYFQGYDGNYYYQGYDGNYYNYIFPDNYQDNNQTNSISTH